MLLSSYNLWVVYNRVRIYNDNEEGKENEYMWTNKNKKEWKKIYIRTNGKFIVVYEISLWALGKGKTTMDYRYNSPNMWDFRFGIDFK